MERTLKKYDACPACGKKDRVFEQLAKEAVDMKVARQDFTASYMSKIGMVIDPARKSTVLIGGKAPGFHIEVDICANCGCIYATAVETMPATNMPKPPSVKPDMFRGS